MALRLRRSQFMTEYLRGQLGEEKELSSLLINFGKNNQASKRKKRAAKQK